MVAIPTARADAPASPECRQAKLDCVKALSAADLAIKEERAYSANLRDELALNKELLVETSAQLDEALSSRSSWYRDPLTMLLIGGILGLVGGSFIK